MPSRKTGTIMPSRKTKTVSSLDVNSMQEFPPLSSKSPQEPCNKPVYSKPVIFSSEVDPSLVTRNPYSQLKLENEEIDEPEVEKSFPEEPSKEEVERQKLVESYHELWIKNFRQRVGRTNPNGIPPSGILPIQLPSLSSEEKYVESKLKIQS